MIYDLILVGGGLSAGMTALCLRHKRADLNVLIIEKESHLGGDHTWSFHPSDVAPSSEPWINPIVSMRWDGHEVRFPEFARSIGSGYCSIRSTDFDVKVRAALGEKVLLNETVTELNRNSVTTLSGLSFTSRCVIDARGIFETKGHLGYQKFVGCFLEMKSSHGLTHPILMDATVAQIDGYRFVYSLPWDATHILIEDTYYSESAKLDRKLVEQRVQDYCVKQGWEVAAVDHIEEGILPIPITDALPRWTNGVPQIGLGGHCFHPTTGFSLPDAVRVAEFIASIAVIGEWNDLPMALRRYCEGRWKRGRFFRLLNRMLFWGVQDKDRYRVLQRFYRLPEPLILDFYRGELSLFENFRIVAGRPPISILTLGRNLWERGLNDLH